MDDARSREGIPWERLFPLRALLRAMRLAAGVRSLFLALIGVWFTRLGWAVGDWLSGQAPVACPFFGGMGAGAVLGPSHLMKTLIPPFELADDEGLIELPRLALENCVAAWQLLSRPFLHALYPVIDVGGCTYFLLCGVWAILVWSIFGTMIARAATVALARDERLSGRRIKSFAFQKWNSVFAAPLTPLLGIGLLTIPLAIFGLLLRFNLGVLLAGIFWPVALVAALAMAVLAVGLLLGWPLMWAAIATEGSDSFDAVSRAYAYVFHRPLLVLWFGLQALLVGVVGVVLARLFCGILLTLCAWGVSWGEGGSPAQAFLAPDHTCSSVGWLGNQLISFWTSLVAFVPAIFPFSYLWTASTAIYFALRHEVDGTEFDEVYLPEEKEAPHRLPTLGTDDAGVPRVEE